MTTEAIFKALERAGKPISRQTLYNYLRRLKIKPVGWRQCPQNYPTDTADRILAALAGNGRKGK